jgi:YidC/Oxa1 family membrane protein insertase
MLLKMFLCSIQTTLFFTSFCYQVLLWKAELHSTNLVKDDKVDTTFTKQFKAVLPLAFKMEKLTKKWIGTTDQLITCWKVDRNLEDIVALGWGFLVGLTVTPSFRCGFLSLFIQHGWAIILFTVLVKLAMSPITYKSFLSQAKNESIETWNQWARKNSKDPMKSNRKQWSFIIKQVWILWLVVLGLMQAPIFLCFEFFPSISLRQKDFFGQMIYPLWLYLWVTISYSSIWKSY